MKRPASSQVAPAEQSRSAPTGTHTPQVCICGPSSDVATNERPRNDLEPPPQVEQQQHQELRRTESNADRVPAGPMPCRHCGGANRAAAQLKPSPAAAAAAQSRGTDSEKSALERTTSSTSDVEKGREFPSVDTPPGPQAIIFPDGGWRAWLVVAGAWCVSFTTWGYTNAFGVSVSWYEKHQLEGRPPSDIAWIGSTQLALVLACAVISGKAFDAGYIKYLLVLGTCIYTVGLFGLSYATTYVQIFLAQGIACGMAAGILFLPAVSAVSHFFRVRRATALGVLATGSSVGGVVYPLLLNHIFPTIGFGPAIRAAGYLTVGLLVVACLTINSRLPPRKTGPIIDFSHFRDPAYSAFVVGECLIMWGLYIPYFYIQSYSSAHGVHPQISLYSLSFLNAASLFGRIIPNWLADIYGPFTILIVSPLRPPPATGRSPRILSIPRQPNCLLSGIICFAWLALAKTNAGTVVFCLAYGFSSGAYVSMMPACVASMTTDMSTIGIRIAMAFLAVSLFALTGTPIAGAMVARENGSYVGATIFSGVMIIAGTCVNGVTWSLMSKRKGTRRV
ncbi:BQ5605_C018g08581 [Microbotryum silenes-dioicae]|uniref:BQ5605_C018g08581 protein n=1 Tax=Microbotryum silenes-dioicae TaxID=796604 RepID=A0A2X0NUA2_9BASI|nr:BQ5605_C018g08581 [Microbotryum silenes-dioicae]